MSETEIAVKGITQLELRELEMKLGEVNPRNRVLARPLNEGSVAEIVAVSALEGVAAGRLGRRR